MRLAIVGSSRVTYAQGKNAIESVRPVVLLDTGCIDEIATFLHGGLHHYAVEFAASERVLFTRLNSAKRLASWKPDLALIFWDGKSRGCPAVLDVLTSAGVLCLSFLMDRSGHAEHLGTNAGDLANTTPDGHDLCLDVGPEFHIQGERDFAHA